MDLNKIADLNSLDATRCDDDTEFDFMKFTLVHFFFTSEWIYPTFSEEERLENLTEMYKGSKIWSNPYKE